MTEYNAILEKSRRFAVRIVKLYQDLDKTKVPRALSDQILRSGTSIGANAAEAHLAPSSTDFYCKLGISLKEAKETEYWLYVLHGADFIDGRSYESINDDCVEIPKILTAILKNRPNRTGKG